MACSRLAAASPLAEVPRYSLSVMEKVRPLMGIQLRDRRQYRLRTDQVSHLRGGLPGNAIDEGVDLSESQVQFRESVDACLRGLHGSARGINRGLCRTDGSPSLGGLLPLVVELALSDGARLGQGSVPRGR